MVDAITLPVPPETREPDSPPPPVAGAVDLVLLEDPTRLSESVLWDLQRAWYETRGVAAWSAALVPHFVSSGAFLAHACPS